ncbi:hypothetical protein AYX15_07141 [Cryptococcus neoformans]|nr:hypothetical protein AYX15_07141 [Cryptococcus neoformans var. grubii]
MNFTSTRSMVVSNHGHHQLNSLGGRIAFSHSSSVIAW